MDMEPKREDESEDGAGQTDLEEEAEPNRWRHPQNWEAYDDPWSDSDVMVTGVNGLQEPALSLHDEAATCPPHTPRGVAPHMPGLPMDHMPPLEAAFAGIDAIEVHVDEVELDNL